MLKESKGFFLACILAFVMPLIAPVGLTIAAGMIGSSDIIDRSIRAVDLGKGSVTKPKLAKNAVTGNKIVDGSIGPADIADGAITAAKIAPGLNADFVDGKHASDFAGANHNHNVAYAATTHDHNAAHYTKTESDGKYALTGHSHDATKTGYLNIPAAYGFNTYDYSYGAAGELEADSSLYAVGGYNVLFGAPVNLPNGTVITNFFYQFYDYENSANPGPGYDTSAKLYRWSGNKQELASLSSSGAVDAWRTVDTSSISSPVVDVSNYSYFVQITLHGPSENLIRAGSVKITYDYAR